MRRLILSIIFLTNLVSLQAQYALIGEVEDTKNNPIAFANVVLFTASDYSYVAGQTTDENGSFMFDNLNENEYRIEISFI